MRKKDWGNAVWFLFHTLAEKIKPEYPAEIPVLLEHIISICNHLPCPDCKQHAVATLARINKTMIAASRENLIDFVWSFHNSVNSRTKAPLYPKEALDRYKTAKTQAIIQNFIKVMSATSNNEKTMLHGFHRTLYIKKFVDYVKMNMHKYNE
jgi:hypothetical protein